MQKKSYQATRKRLKTVIFWNVFTLFFTTLSMVSDGKPFSDHSLQLITTFAMCSIIFVCVTTFRRDFKHENEPRNLNLKLPK